MITILFILVNNNKILNTHLSNNPLRKQILLNIYRDLHMILQKFKILNNAIISVTIKSRVWRQIQPLHNK